jgi:hypothetical protein
MGKFDELYLKLLETMIAGGNSGVFGSAANNGDHGGEFPGGSDFYAKGTTVMPKPLFGKTVQKRNLSKKKKIKM